MMSDDLKKKLLDAALSHAPFDGWSSETFKMAADDCGVALSAAQSLFPRRAIGMAAEFHKHGDALMAERLQDENLLSMRYRDRVATAIRIRLEVIAQHKEAVRRSVALFSLPHNAPEGTGLVWGSADAIWNALGDHSDDLNWYTKRATLSGVYGASVIYWLGDTSEGHHATWEFVDRRIDDVMQIEKFKAKLKENPLTSMFLTGPEYLFSKLRPCTSFDDANLPGSIMPESKAD